MEDDIRVQILEDLLTIATPLVKAMKFHSQSEKVYTECSKVLDGFDKYKAAYPRRGNDH